VDVERTGSWWEASWPARPASVSEARTSVARLAVGFGARGETADGIKLAVGEACANAVVHGCVGEEPDTFSVSVGHSDHRMQVVVRDRGRGMCPRPDSPGAGLGLPIISQLAESFEVRTPADGVGTELCMTFALDA